MKIKKTVVFLLTLALTMKSQFIAIVAAVLVVGCGESQPPEPPDISIHDAAFEGNIEAVKKHLAAGTDVNVKDEDGWTPLHWVAPVGSKVVAELLIAAGADVNAQDEDGWTPLDLALFGRSTGQPNEEIVDLLRKHGGKKGTLRSGKTACKPHFPR